MLLTLSNKNVIFTCTSVQANDVNEYYYYYNIYQKIFQLTFKF